MTVYAAELAQSYKAHARVSGRFSTSRSRRGGRGAGGRAALMGIESARYSLRRARASAARGDRLSGAGTLRSFVPSEGIVPMILAFTILALTLPLQEPKPGDAKPPRLSTEEIAHAGKVVGLD